MIPNNPISWKLYFQFDLEHSPPLAAVDTDCGWSLYQGDDAIALSEFVTRYINLEDYEQNPPDEL